MLFVALSGCGLADRPFLRTRKELLRGALASGAAAFASRSADAAGLPWDKPERDVVANPLQNRFLEKVRILLQDEADATQYGGELAPGGPPVGLPYLSLVPIVQMQSVLVRSRDSVAMTCETNPKPNPKLNPKPNPSRDSVAAHTDTGGPHPSPGPDTEAPTLRPWP
eukprot:scaffold83974_cov45-Phaeocystis_antarctica.AAC.4